jgi:hypothetical protein
VSTLGFTRLAVSQAATNVLKHETLPERSLDMLFGKEDVRKALIRAWLEEGFDAMGPTPTTVRDALHKRLDWNKPVLDKLPEVRIFPLHHYDLTLSFQAYALLATPTSLVPSIDLKAVIEHPARVAHTACRLSHADESGVRYMALDKPRFPDRTFLDILVHPKSGLGHYICYGW